MELGAANCASSRDPACHVCRGCDSARASLSAALAAFRVLRRLVSLFLALTSPIHELGEQLFSAHMLQHEIMILVSAPLISASHPGATCLWAFAPRGRAGIGAWVHRMEQMRVIRLLAAPLIAWLMEAIALWVWHIPALYQATLQSDWIHAAQHLSFFLTAVVFWSALYGVGRSALSYGAGTFYVFGTAVHCSALGALLTFSTVLWYPAVCRDNGAVGLHAAGRSAAWWRHHVGSIGNRLHHCCACPVRKWLSESDRRLKLGSLEAALQQGEHT